MLQKNLLQSVEVKTFQKIFQKMIYIFTLVSFVKLLLENFLFQSLLKYFCDTNFLFRIFKIQLLLVEL